MGLPIPKLDDKTYDEIVQEARSLIARYAPGWTDHNIHDPGITFIELFAWIAEMQIYQLNQVTEANYRKFLKLVGINPLSAQPARVDITFREVTVEKLIEAGTQLITKVGTKKIVFETEEDYTLIPTSLKSIITKYNSQTMDNTRANEKDDIHFAAFGEKAPEGAKLLLGFNDELPLKKEFQITFALFEKDLPPAGRHGDEREQISPSVEVVWEYLSEGTWKALTVRKDSTLALMRSGRVVFIRPSSMDKKDQLYWIRCRLKKGHYEINPQINRILLNTVSVVQVETIQNENPGTGRGIPGQVVQLKKHPVIRKSLAIQVQKEDSEWEGWKEVDDFESSGPDDHHYLFDPEKGEITFGNGLNGRIISGRQNIRASYKTTLASEGNIPRRQRFLIDGITGENRSEGSGGMAAESIDDAKERARKDFRTRYRAITSNDYERIALFTPGLRVARAKAIPNYNPDFPCITNFAGAVTVVVVPYAREGTVTPVPGDGFINSIFEHLDKHRLITTDLYVIGPAYVKVSVKCNVSVKKRSSQAAVSKRVQKALEAFLDTLKGGNDGRGWPFGRSVYPSEIFRIIDKVEGVDYATDVSISAEGQYKKAGEVIRIPPVALVYSGKHEVEII